MSNLRAPAQGERSNLAACVPYVQGTGSVLVVSDFLSEGEMRADLAALLQRCAALHALQVSDEAETDPGGADARECELEDAETGQRLHVTLGPHARALAQAERHAMTVRMRAFCIRNRIAFTDWAGDEPWQRALVRHLVEAKAAC